MKWFQHDSNSSMDSKLQEILLDYGLEGYGLYWYCLELVAMNVDGNSLTFELEHDARIIARNTGSTVQKVETMMKRFIELGLFDRSEGIITCLKLAKRCDEYTSKLIRNKRLDKCPDTVGTKSALIEENTIEEKRGEQNINTSVAIAPVKQKRFITPNNNEVFNYMFGRGLSQDQAQSEAEKFCDFYISKNWHVGKTKMKDWKASVRNWLRNYKPTTGLDMDNTDWINDMGEVL